MSVGNGQQTAADRAATVNNEIVAQLKSGATSRQVADDLLAKYGVVTKTATSDTVTPLSSQGNVSVASPQILYDSCGGGWYVYASYRWNSMTAVHDDAYAGGCGPTCNVGGEDGFGVALSRNVAAVRSYFMQTWGQTSYYPVSSGRTYASDANTYGVTFKGQDRFCPYSCIDHTTPDYSFYNGELFYNISSIGCGTIQAFSKYAHDWSSTTINGFGVGPWQLNVSWSSSSNRWELASQPSNAVTPC
jgi:hypothetical protein